MNCKKKGDGNTRDRGTWLRRACIQIASLRKHLIWSTPSLESFGRGAYTVRKSLAFILWPQRNLPSFEEEVENHAERVPLMDSGPRQPLLWSIASVSL